MAKIVRSDRMEPNYSDYSTIDRAARAKLLLTSCGRVAVATLKVISVRHARRTVVAVT